MKNLSFIFWGFAMTFCFNYLSKDLVKTNDKIDFYNLNSDKQSDIIFKENDMKLGAFSISLNVKDLKTSKIFYEKMGFKVFGGAMEKNYLIMKNENSLIGLFQGMFQGNILTFNPGWDENAHNIEKFQDIRDIQKDLKTNNFKWTSEVTEGSSGPGSIMLEDPDGNVILIDQHR